MRQYAWFLLLGLAACGTSPPSDTAQDVAPSDIALTTNLPSYGPGGEVTIRLRNATQRQYGYNLCNSQVQRLQGASWVQFQAAAEICTMELRMLQPGGEATFAFRLQQNIPAGQYRVQTSVEDQAANQSQVLTSNTFAVTPRGPSGD